MIEKKKRFPSHRCKGLQTFETVVKWISIRLLSIWLVTEKNSVRVVIDIGTVYKHAVFSWKQKPIQQYTCKRIS